MKRQIASASGLSFFLLFLFSSSVFADFKLLDAIQEFGEKRFIKPQPTRLKAGPLQIHPTLRTSVQYDDNVLLEQEDEKKDVIFNIKPGAILEIPIDKHQVALGYEGEFEIFSKLSRQNDQNQAFFALGDFHFPDWYVNILERLVETSSRSGSTFTGRIPHIDQSIHPKVGYQWKRLIFEAGFRHFLRDFRRVVDAPFDFQLYEGSGVIYYNLFARLKALLEYQAGWIVYDHNPTRRGTIHQGRVGVEGEVLPNVLLKARVGPQFRNYRTASEADFNSWVGDLAFEYEVRKNLKLKLTLSRSPVEATFGEVNFYKEHAAGFGVEYQLRPQWTLFAEPQYALHHYAERAVLGNQVGFRRDRLISSKSGVRYLAREWLEFECAYEFLYRESNMQGLSYNDNRFSFTTNLTY